MTVQTVKLPERAGSRQEARADMSRTFPPSVNLRGATIEVDGRLLEFSAPSYLDEMIKILLIERGAAKLVLRNVPSRARGFIRNSAVRRDVSHLVNG